MQESSRWVVGPQAPRVADTPPATQGTATQGTSPGWVWVGAHGGAGVTTLCRAAGVGLDCARQWPQSSSDRAGERVLLVARTHGGGLAAVRGVLGTRGPTAVHGVVLVADAPGRLPRELRQQIRVLSGAAPRLWQVPWVEAWRTDATATPPRHIVALLSAVTTPLIGELG